MSTGLATALPPQRGFILLDADARRAVAHMGRRAVKGPFQFRPEEARAAGRKGGLETARRRRAARLAAGLAPIAPRPRAVRAEKPAPVPRADVGDWQDACYGSICIESATCPRCGGYARAAADCCECLGAGVLTTWARLVAAMANVWARAGCPCSACLEIGDCPCR